MLREADEMHDKDVETLRASFLERQRVGDEALRREKGT